MRQSGTKVGPSRRVVRKQSRKEMETYEESDEGAQRQKVDTERISRKTSQF
jgi:hypothetical protein